MDVSVPGHVYNMFQIGGTKQRIVLECSGGVHTLSLMKVVLERTKYLDSVLPCNESGDAICFLEDVVRMHEKLFGKQGSFEVVDVGHIYKIDCIGGGTHTLTFLKRSGGAITYDTEFEGTQTQEVLRVLIDRLKMITRESSSKEVTPGSLTKQQETLTMLLLNLRNALFLYEVRAYRRKKEKVNRKRGVHDDNERPKSWRTNVFKDIPFEIGVIETYPIGDDGHIIVKVL